MFILRKVQSKKLDTNYKGEPDIYQLLRKAEVLPLVPNSEKEDVWFQALVDL